MSSVTLDAEQVCTDEVDGLENCEVAEQENTDEAESLLSAVVGEGRTSKSKVIVSVSKIDKMHPKVFSVE